MGLEQVLTFEVEVGVGLGLVVLAAVEVLEEVSLKVSDKGVNEAAFSDRVRSLLNAYELRKSLSLLSFFERE